jgi:hypothetical protein
MTPIQIDFLRDFAIDKLPRAKSDREQTRLGGNLYERLAFTSAMVRGKAGTTATEYAAATVLESVCLLQQPLSTKQRADTLHNLTDAANGLCLHSGKTIAWLGEVAPPPPEPKPEPPAMPLPSIAGKWLSTKEAAEALGFAVQTLRGWSSTESGPIRPVRVARSLKWSGDDILTVLRGPVCAAPLASKTLQNPRVVPT